LTKKRSIGFIGTRGIPNEYGGYEAAVQELAPRLVLAGYEVVVYCSKRLKNREKTWKGVKLIYGNDPENRIGSAGQLIYDLICNISSYKQKHDVIFHMGYTSDSIWHWLWDRNAKHITNVDGIEWKRSKYSHMVQKFLKVAEKLAVKRSNLVISDSTGIMDYIKQTYDYPSEYIAYGVEIPADFNEKYLLDYSVSPGEYDLIIARMVPENNIEMIIEAKIKSDQNYPLLIIGNENQYYKKLISQYKSFLQIRFSGSNYNQDVLNSLRYYSRYYLHGHSVGGTNPSLLESMAAQCRILAHDNIFNRGVLLDGGEYFSSAEQLARFLSVNESIAINEKQVNINLDLLSEKYSWDIICNKYEEAIHKVWH
jgi:glycosyltransferase involved in cell wall biosynthesis